MRNVDPPRGEDEEPNGLLVEQIKLKVLILPSGRSPYRDWYKGIKDAAMRQRIDARLFWVQAGNFGDAKPVGGEV